MERHFASGKISPILDYLFELRFLNLELTNDRMGVCYGLKFNQQQLSVLLYLEIVALNGPEFNTIL
jgi:hypothetical protein